MTVHKEAIHWLATKIPNSIENHFLHEFNIDGLYPDVVTMNKSDDPEALHEVESVNIRGLPNIGLRRILWLLINSKWDAIQVISTSPFEAEEIKHAAKLSTELERQITDLETTKKHLQERVDSLRHNFIQLKLQEIHHRRKEREKVENKMIKDDLNFPEVK